MGADTIILGRKEETRMKIFQWQLKSEWKNTEIWKAQGEKVIDTNTGGSPGYLSQSQ